MTQAQKPAPSDATEEVLLVRGYVPAAGPPEGQIKCKAGTIVRLPRGEARIEQRFRERALRPVGRRIDHLRPLIVAAGRAGRPHQVVGGQPCSKAAGPPEGQIKCKAGTIVRLPRGEAKKAVNAGIAKFVEAD